MSIDDIIAEVARTDDYDDEAYEDLECPTCREISDTDEEFLNHECKEYGDY